MKSNPGKSLVLKGTSYWVVFALILVSSASLAKASTISYSGNYSFALSPGSQTLNLSQFDPTLGTLTGVKLGIVANVHAHVTAENDSNQSGNMGVDLTGIVKASAPSSLSATAGISQSAGPVPVGPSDGNPGSGPDFHDFGTITGSDSASNTLGSGFAPYIGLGTISVPVNGSGGFSVTGVSDSTIHVTDFGGDGTATVTYTYNAIPEPSTIVLGAFGTLAVGLSLYRRRRR